MENLRGLFKSLEGVQLPPDLFERIFPNPLSDPDVQPIVVRCVSCAYPNSECICPEESGDPVEEYLIETRFGK